MAQADGVVDYLATVGHDEASEMRLGAVAGNVDVPVGGVDASAEHRRADRQAAAALLAGEDIPYAVSALAAFLDEI